MKLIAPPGYGAVVPFNKENHSKLSVKEDQRFSFAKNLNAVFTTVTEFVQCARTYPVVFSKLKDSEEYIAMAVTGLATGENRFIDEQGNWQAGTYVPAYIRRYPFCVVEIQPDTDTTPQQLVCVDETALIESEQSFFEEDGEATKEWQQFQHFMQEYETSRIMTQAFTSKLVEHDLFEVFEAKAMHVSGQEYHMTNMYRVNEKKLKKLTAKVLRDLMGKNYMYFIYAHLMSLDNFQLLLDREKTQ